MTNPLQAQFTHMFFTLIFMVGLIVLLAFLYKKLGGAITRNNNELKLLSTLPLGTKEKLLLIQVGDQQLLLGATASNINILHELTNPVAIDNPQATTKRDFKKILEGLKK